MEQQPTQNRMIHYDMLRILAALSVVLLHTSAQFWNDLPLTENSWLIANSYNALSRFGVPVFVALSGALFLSDTAEINYKKLYLHNILRLFIVYVIWSCVYGLIDCLVFFDLPQISAGVLLREMLYGRYHLWYLPVLIAIYMLLPILKIWVQHATQDNIRYFLLLFLIFQIGRETINALFPYSDVLYATSLISPDMVCSYTGYFILGYYLANYGIAEKYHKYIYLAVIPSALCNVFLSARLSRWKGEPLIAAADCFSVFTFVIVIAIFLFFTTKVKRMSPKPGARKLLTELSRDTLGVYVMHIALIELLCPLGIHSMTLPGLIGIPLFTVFCYVVCTVLAAIFRRIPLIGRYIC